MLGSVPPALGGLAYDSRKVARGELFVAVPGLKQDGRRFIADALDRGAAAVVFDGPDVLAGSDTGRILVPPPARRWRGSPTLTSAIPRARSPWSGSPAPTARRRRRSSSTRCCARVAGPTGLIGTIEYRIGEERLTASQTTPEALELQSLLARMVERGVAGVAMEVSSHALALHRADGIEFDVAVFTNLTQDHLDFHVTLEAYRARQGAPLPAARPGSEGPARRGDQRRRSVGRRRWWRGSTCRRSRSVWARRRRSVRGTTARAWTAFTWTSTRRAGASRSPRPSSGEHNVMNLLGADRRRARARDGSRGHRPGALAGVRAVPGRFERVEAGQPFLVVVDYAHTPDALERVLATARKLLTGGGRLAAVFGCGGDRDRGKRPIMGEIAARLADRAWVTSDNPRSERPEAIVAEIVAGIPAADRDRHVALPDRRTAIRAALTWARRATSWSSRARGMSPTRSSAPRCCPSTTAPRRAPCSRSARHSPRDADLHGG